ncbi:hypothetical protein K488DRAFT_52171 [Vararia minispora EC-137]|uniref:Uncharacterized protein n=1 Tax=Vararia minispora EC-137 TaxID=1314806 RepID=A0ACB8QIG9_9AGAM|nr:hypothetical protein K488DRAFT_52171 [Vararia minispora EC-137]
MSNAPAKTILLYDIPGNCSPDKAYSPSVWKTRLVLNYKKLLHKTEWVEYPDIAPLAQKIGASPCGQKPDGGPLYAVPILYDPVTESCYTDSFDIALHLEAAYTNAPSVFPNRTKALIRAWDEIWMEKAGRPMYQLILSSVHAQLSQASQTYFRETREAKFGTLEAPPDTWEKLEHGLSSIDAYMAQSRFVMGEQMTYADMVMAGWLICVRRVLGMESDGWRRIEQWHNGRWKRFVDEFAHLEYV